MFTFSLLSSSSKFSLLTFDPDPSSGEPRVGVLLEVELLLETGSFSFITFDRDTLEQLSPRSLHGVQGESPSHLSLTLVHSAQSNTRG